MTNLHPGNILTIKNLSKRFGRAQVLKNVKLSLGLGEIYAIIGPNGAGKTTLFNLVTGIIEKDEGVVLYYEGVSGGGVRGGVVSGRLVSGGGVSGRLVSGGEVSGRGVNGEVIDITGFKPHQVARLGIGRTFQGNRVFNNMTVLENVMFAKQLIDIENPISIMKSSYKKRLKKLKNRNNFEFNHKEEKEQNLEVFLRKEAEYWLDFVGLKDKMDNKAEELSYGQQKLLSIARLLMADSRLLLFDEPTAGVNPKYAARIAEIFKKIIENKDKTILFIEHDMKFIQKLGCKCLYIEAGKCPWPFFELEVIMKNADIRRKFMGM
jgi:branched-chain amino acid transport system ATP-binding protein